MSHAPALREYQLQALVAEDAWRAEHPDQNRLAIVLPTGTGKTILFSERARRFLAAQTWPKDDQSFTRERLGVWPDSRRQRVLILVHTDELTDQAEKRARFMCEPYSVGVVKADRDEVDADIIVASVQTLSVPGRKERITDVGYVIVDEVQYGVTPMWKRILEHFGCLAYSSNVQYHTGYDSSGIREHVDQARSQEGTGIAGPGSLERVGSPSEPQRGSRAGHEDALRERGGRSRGDVLTPMLGVTATLARSDGQGFGDLIHEAVYTRSTSWAIRKGYLIDVIPYTIKIPEIDAAASDARLDAQLADSIAPEAVVTAWIGKSPLSNTSSLNYPSTVLFAPLVKSARAFADAFNEAGVKAEVVHGAMPKAERKAVLERYEAGVTTVVCNAMALTVGWDSPRTMCVIVARPTKSVPLFVQMVGRGLRPWLSAEAPPREEQRCVLLCVSDGVTDLACVADLSDRPGEQADGKTLTAMEDEWDLGRDIEPDGTPYAGPVVVERWDAAVQASSKAWKYTAGGIPFLPTAKRGEGYVFVVEDPLDWKVWMLEKATDRRGNRFRRLAAAPDLELAMAAAEDAVHDHGGDIGRLLADKNRAWRRDVPSAEMKALAQRLGINVVPIMENRKGGKAGRLSDLIDKVVASRVIDPVAVKIKERVKA